MPATGCNKTLGKTIKFSNERQVYLGQRFWSSVRWLFARPPTFARFPSHSCLNYETPSCELIRWFGFQLQGFKLSGLLVYRSEIEMNTQSSGLASLCDRYFTTFWQEMRHCQNLMITRKLWGFQFAEWKTERAHSKECRHCKTVTVRPRQRRTVTRDAAQWQFRSSTLGAPGSNYI